MMTTLAPSPAAPRAALATNHTAAEDEDSCWFDPWNATQQDAKIHHRLLQVCFAPSCSDISSVTSLIGFSNGSSPSAEISVS